MTKDGLPRSDTTNAAEIGFRLDPQLDADTLPVGDLALSQVLLMNDRRYPWLILVPRQAGLVEVTDLSDEDAARLMREIRLAATALADLFNPLKINVATLGNAVRQLHVHVIARFESDVAWPRPIWGVGAAEHYPDHAAMVLIDRLRDQFVKL